jgi:serine phosphatase RsbU (regulator of sigma subunit)
MDIALLSIDKTNKQIEFAGAFNPLWIIRNKQLIEIKADKHPVGAFIYEELKQFTPHYFETLPGDILYIFTDGYADQFGGTKGKKYKYKPLQDLLISVSDQPMTKQKEILNSNIEDWKGNLEQVDDILMIGIKI